MNPADRDRAEAIERFEAEHPEEAMRRRDFLGRTAALAGSTALATTLPPDRLVQAAARAQRRVALPAPRNMPIDTFVVLMMENRSFDHYFGWHPRADGRNRGLVYPDAGGNPVATRRLTPDYQGCSFRDPDHSWDGGRHQWGRGRMNGFVQGNKEGTGSDEFAAGYYLKNDLGFIPHVAEGFQLYDRFFCSLMAPTFPNRHYMWGAQSGGTRTNSFPFKTLGYQWETIFDRARARGVSALYYNVDLPASSLYGPRAIPWTEHITSYYLRAAEGTLPHITFVDPPFGDIGALGGGASDHPHSDIRLGQAYMSDIVHAFMESPQWERGALFIVYDEWGGFFDHVQPRFVPDDRRSRDLYEDFGMTGFRIPAVAASPYVRPGNVSHATMTFESILKLISYRFGLGYLNKRHRYASNIGRTFAWNRRPAQPPELPDPTAIASAPCVLSEATGGSQRHDMVTLESSGYLDRVGFEARSPSFGDLFRRPDAVRTAFREAG